MGAWSEGMQANDTALDWICNYQKYDAKEGIPLNKKARDIVAGKRPLLPDLMAIKQRKDGSDWAQAVLGVAEFFLDHGVDLKPCRAFILKAIKNQLSEDELGCWGSIPRRRNALLRFKARLMGKKVSKRAVAQDNEGLLSKLAKVAGI